MSKAPLSRKGDRKRRIRLSGKNTGSFSLDTSGFESFLEDLGAAAEEAVRPAAQAGAQVLYDAVKANVGKIGKVSGNLAASIYQAYSHSNSDDLRATYHVSWNHKKAPHGGLLEYGHWQRYQVVQTRAGKWVTVIRPEKVGQPKPKRRASQAEKDAYYMPRPGGPVYVPGKAFMRNALATTPNQVLDAMRGKIFEAWDKVK